MSRWFRFYDGALDDPKVQSLPAELFKTWVNLLCVASRHEGTLPLSDLAFMLRMDERRVTAAVKDLTQRGLIDDNGNGPEPHNWSGRQHKSDVSNERVKRHRQRARNNAGNVTSAVSVAPPDTDTDTEEIQSSEPNGSGASAPVGGLEVQVFRRGKEVLGKSAGGVIAKLRAHYRGDLEAALSAIEQAAGKQDPMEWVQGILRKPDPDDEIYRGAQVMA